jgi:ATP-dependent DNA helicase RecQ
MHRRLHSSAETREQLPRITDLRIKNNSDDSLPAARHAALVRDEYRCAKCGADNPSELDVHHRMPRSIQVDHSAANLITLCDGCHAALHLNLQVGLARGVIQRWAVRLARVLDFRHELPTSDVDFGLELQVLGKQKLRDGQLPIILAILAGKDVLAVRPTGSGKSLCFQVPVLRRSGTGLVIEPLKALMKDQVRGLHDLQIPATFISSDASPQERRQRYDLLEQGSWKFLYMAPERFNPTLVKDPTEYDRLIRFRPNYLVIDEAHTISQYGDGFRPSYAQLGSIRQRLGRPQVLAFTATASKDMQRRICESLGSPDAQVITENPDRPNIALVRLPMAKQDPRRFDVVASLLSQVRQGRSIIFVPTRPVGERVQAGLARRGIHLEFFHSNAHDANWRDNVQGRFTGRLLPAINAVIATSAFGMGLDIPDIRLVVHWQHPFSVEEYLQGLGRAGRDGRRALALLFTDQKEDLDLLNWMVDQEPGPQSATRHADIEAMSRIANARHQCFRRDLVGYLVGTEIPKKSWSIRILEWAFGARVRIERAAACCDRCSPGLVAGLLDGRSTLFTNI